MGKKKSIVFITLITILLAALIFFSFVPFPTSSVDTFKSFVGSSQLGMELAGGVETVYYPDGVISNAKYQEMQSSYNDLKAEYDIKKAEWDAAADKTGMTEPIMPTNEADDYTAYKGIYIKNENFTDIKTGQISDVFREDFEQAFRAIQSRFEKKLYTNYSIFKQDDYTIVVRVPKTQASHSNFFSMMSANGGLQFLGAENTTESYIKNHHGNLVRSASVVSTSDGYGVRLNLTPEGKAKVKELTEGAGESNNNGATIVGQDNSTSKTVYIYLGTKQLLSASTKTQLDTSTLVMPVGESRDSADTIAALINLAKSEKNIFRMKFNKLEEQVVNTFGATMGSYTALILLLTLLAVAVGGIIYMFIRYKGLGFVYLLSMVTFILAVILCTTFIPVLVITPTSFIAILFAQLLITIFTIKPFNRIKEEFKKGKTLAKAIRDAFNASAFLTAEVHGALFVIATLIYAIATGMMQSVSLLFMITIALSAGITLGLNRFYLYLTMPQAKNKIAYCNLRKEVIDLDDDE